MQRSGENNHPLMQDVLSLCSTKSSLTGDYFLDLLHIKGALQKFCNSEMIHEPFIEQMFK